MKRLIRSFAYGGGASIIVCVTYVILNETTSMSMDIVHILVSSIGIGTIQGVLKYFNVI